MLTKLPKDNPIVPVRVVNVSAEERKVVAGRHVAKCEAVNFVYNQDFESVYDGDVAGKTIPVVP